MAEITGSALDRSTGLRVLAAAAPLRQQVTERLSEAIAQGLFKPGDRLVERELCESLGVSRTSLREALRELETDGIVTSVANRGVIVSRISPESAREIYEIRGMLEGLLARRFAELGSDRLIADFERAVQALARSYKTGSGVPAAKQVLYELLFEGAQHKLASAMLRSIQLRASQLRLMTLSHPDRAKQSMSEMRALLAAIKNRDPDAACAAAQLHVRRAGALALQLLERELAPAPAGA